MGGTAATSEQYQGITGVGGFRRDRSRGEDEAGPPVRREEISVAEESPIATRGAGVTDGGWVIRSSNGV
jgi:hypothetical protein